MAVTFTGTVVRPDGVTLLLSASAAELPAVVVGASSFKPGQATRLSSAQALDAALASASGKARPVMNFWHAYNSTLPATFSGSAAAAAPANGWGAMLNVRAPWGEIRTTAGRTALQSFLSSVPANLPRLWLMWAHEPENDGLTAAQQDAYRRDMAEFVRIVVDHGDPRIVPCSCFMGDPPVAWDSFDFFPLLRPGDVDRMVCLFDAYPRCRTGPDRTDDPGFKYDGVATWLRARGARRLGIGETTLNNDAGIAQSYVDDWWSRKLPAWLAANRDVEVVALYDATGPAAGTNGMLDTPGELTAAARLMRP